MNGQLDLSKGAFAEGSNYVVGADSLIDLGLLAALRRLLRKKASGSSSAVGAIGGRAGDVDFGYSSAIVFLSDGRGR